MVEEKLHTTYLSMRSGFCNLGNSQNPTNTPSHWGQHFQPSRSVVLGVPFVYCTPQNPEDVGEASSGVGLSLLRLLLELPPANTSSPSPGPLRGNRHGETQVPSHPLAL